MAAKKKAPAKKAAARASAKTAEISSEEASKIVKKYAAKQKISVKLTEEQLNELLRQWNDNPKQPAEITFHVGARAMMRMTVAAYRYRGDTCCV